MSADVSDGADLIGFTIVLSWPVEDARSVYPGIDIVGREHSSQRRCSDKFLEVSPIGV